MTFNAADYLLHARVRDGIGGKQAVVGTRTSTYAELSEEVSHAAAGLRGLGLHSDDRVMLVMADDVDMAVAVLAAFHAGLVAVPVSTMFGGDELTAVMADSGARAVVTTDEFVATAATAVDRSPDVEFLLVAGASEPQVRSDVSVRSWKSVAECGDVAKVHPTGEDSWALWLYTSGTTGSPKAAMHRHANVRWVCETYGKQTLGIRSDDICLSIAKMFFAYGIGNSLFFPLCVGATSVFERARPTPTIVESRLLATRPTLFFAVPTFYATLLDSVVSADAFSSVRLGVSAGEALPAALQEKFLARFGSEILDGIGSTEALHIFLSNSPGDIKHGTTGKAVPGYELQIRDDDGKLVDAGTPGHLFVRGESIALGYWHRTEASRTVFEGRWLSTGDTYVRDDDGYYKCMGRSNDLLKAGGIWVSPTEVEARLLQHPAVGQAAVVGLADAAGLDKPVAVVVLSQDHEPVTPEQLIDWCREGLASFKRPREVVFADDLPKTATGKLQRFRVKEQLLSNSIATAATGVR
ncbi:benzoate-CoA ligase family protein [Antrihabitans cavernicola]|uniref:Benzoate-CoA ligase family protein n=1 Tax=Antrihabitans cavernicola TaxID=2495913 RepID=A0A5A7S3S6_9NOCA|nr:benzoate-CoA ligase family protein [Spelaeibacter cavernicola]KAA0020039.1 benzoate-CoA ligase family protein [Spelaeibacter cavernicola]